MSARRTATCLLSLAVALLGHTATAQVAGNPNPVAVIECTVPDMDTFVVHGAVPLPRGYTFNTTNCPFSLYRGATRLLTQWEPIAYRADGTLAVAEFLAVVDRGTLTVGARASFDLRTTPSADPDLPLTAGAAFVAQMLLRSEDVFGTKYEGTLGAPTLQRLGAAQVTAEYQTRLVPVGTIGPNPLPQLGAAQVWISARAGTGVIEVVVNYHNGSSQHPTWHLYFKKLELLFPSSHLPVAMLPETMSGSTYVEGSRTVLPLLREIPGKMQFLEQRHEREFRYFLFPNSALGWQHAVALRQKHGWAVARNVVVNPLTGAKGWSFMRPATPGFLPQMLPMPDLAHVQTQCDSRLNQQKNTLWNELFHVPQHSVGEDIPTAAGDLVFMNECFRNPFGVQYGGMTSGTNIHPCEGMETLWTGNENGIILAQMVMRSYQDRQPGAIYEDNGKSFRADDAQYLNANGSQPYSLFNNVFVSAWGAPGGTWDAPWEWDQASRSHEQQAASAGKVPAYRDTLLGWDPIDTQHFFRVSRMMKMLVYLDNDPLARRRIEAACQLLRATYYDGPGGRLTEMRSGPMNIGSGFGREHAEAADIAAAAYSIGGSAWRNSWRPWHELLHDVLAYVQTPGGYWQASQYGKAAQDPPFGNGQTANFRVMQPREHMFSMHALRGVKEAVFAEGADPTRYAQAGTMLVDAGEAIWRLLWRWKPDGSGPDGGGTWDRVAVGPAGPVTPADMYDSHADHPPEQFLPPVYLDGFQTGVGLGIWCFESPTITSELLSALQTFWGTTNVLQAALNNGISNIWNNAVLIAFIQLNF